RPDFRQVPPFDLRRIHLSTVISNTNPDTRPVIIRSYPLQSDHDRLVGLATVPMLDHICQGLVDCQCKRVNIARTEAFERRHLLHSSSNNGKILGIAGDAQLDTIELRRHRARAPDCSWHSLRLDRYDLLVPSTGPGRDS